MTDSKTSSGMWRLLPLPILLVAGFAAVHFEWIDIERLLELAEELSGIWWLPKAVVLSMAALFVVAMPGSIFFWVAGLLYDPVPATLMVTAGGVSGSVGAYVLARYLCTPSAARPDDSSAVYRFLKKRSDFFTLCAMRSLPFFPHTVINYGAGILHVPLPRFIASTAIGFAIKGFFYVSAIHGAAEADEVSDLMDRSLLLPLLGMSLLLLAGGLLHRRWIARNP